MRLLRTAFIALSISITSAASASSLADSLIAAYSDTTATVARQPQKRSLWTKFTDYFKNANKPKPYKKFDFSILGGPHYSSDTKLGIGLVAAGFYRPDSLCLPSNVSLYGDISTVGFYLIGIRGNHIFNLNRDRIDYNLYFYSFPRKFWGLGYEAGNNMNNESKFDEIFVKASAFYLHEFAPHLFIGPGASFVYAHAAKEERPELWDGQASHTATSAVGLRLQYDTRDNLTETQHGVLLLFEQRFSPRFLGNNYAFSTTEVKIAGFRDVWKGGVLAGQLHGTFNYGNVPWASMATFGGSNTMRGYYEGRFRDKCAADLTVELRQHVWRRNGIVVWGGVGTVFSKFSQVQMRRLLPNGGIGYRWQFKQRTNVRIDYGFAKGETAFIFSINEAF